jgi:F-type H+-transporting ATPase subunit b
MEFLGKLGIDFKLLIAQIINFLVLLWLLKAFLYKPLLKNLQERFKKAREIEQAEKEIQKKREVLKDTEEEMIKRTKEKTSQIIEQGKIISKEEKERILSRTEAEMHEILKGAREKVKFELEKAKAEEKEEIFKKTRDVLEKILSKSFFGDLHKKYTGEAIKELKKVNLRELRDKEIISVTIISAYPLAKEESKQISDLFFQKLANPVFEEKIDPSLIAGIKVVMDRFILIDASLKEKIEKAIY